MLCSFSPAPLASMQCIPKKLSAIHSANENPQAPQRADSLSLVGPLLITAPGYHDLHPIPIPTLHSWSISISTALSLRYTLLNSLLLHSSNKMYLPITLAHEVFIKPHDI